MGMAHFINKKSMVKLGFDVKFENSLGEDYDCVVIVGENTDSTSYPEFVHPYLKVVNAASETDTAINKEVSVHYTDLKPGLLVYAPTGPTNRDYDDSRRYKDAAINGIKRALKAGKRKPLVVVYSSEAQSSSPTYKDAVLVAILGAFEALYVPIEIRELPEKKAKVDKIGIASALLKTEKEGNEMIEKAQRLEEGRVVTRDIGGSDPERMAPGKVEEYVTDLFKGTGITVTVTSGHEKFKEDYPLFAAVDRCANMVPRHQGRIIYLEYNGGDVKKTYFFVGKGVTYDTGGADVKAGGVMAGMHRDKCGAATVAGLFAVLEAFKPKGIRVVGRMAMVRNSIGADCYVADEIITSKAGCRVRVGNTDAEGRMAMADSLHHCKVEALEAVDPHLFTIATLTGHAIVAVGDPYSIVLDNGPAHDVNTARNLQDNSDSLADPFEVSTLRREDYDFVEGRNEYEDVIQCNNLPSSRTPRGHQFPAAFMVRASGLDKHGKDSSSPLKYSHIDIAGSSGVYPGIPTAAPIPGLARMMNII